MIWSTLVASVVAAAAPIPFGTLTVTYRQLQDEKLSDSLHHVELFCHYDECEVRTITLNQCMNGSFFPKLEVGDAKVLAVSETSIDVEQQLDGATFRMHFDFVRRSNPKLQKVARAKHPFFFGPLVGFSGRAGKFSDILDENIAWEMVPLKGAYSTVELKCPANLEGVPE